MRTIAPAVPGLHARVLNFDDRIELVYDGDRPLVVEGYRHEPYLRFQPDGTVQVNRRSPATYLNDDRFAQVDVPARADRRAAPVWRTVAENGRYDWHDHRIHWMSEGTLPPRVKDEAKPVKVFDWTIPMAAADQPVKVRGTLRWLGKDGGGFPVAAGISLGLAALAGVVLIAFVRRRRGRGREARRRERPPVKEAW